AKVEGQRGCEFTGLVDDPGPTREASTLFGVAAQVRERARVEPPLHLFEALARAKGREDVVARDGVGRAVVPDLDRDVVATEGGAQTLEFTLGGARTLLHECARHGSL